MKASLTRKVNEKKDEREIRREKKDFDKEITGREGGREIEIMML